METSYQDAIGRRFRELLSVSDQDLLARYYLKGETAESICRSLGITVQEFRTKKALCKGALAAGLKPKPKWGLGAPQAIVSAPVEVTESAPLLVPGAEPLPQSK
jgi:hypothetical protein